MCSLYCVDIITRLVGADIGVALKLKYLIQVLPLVHLVRTLIRNVLRAQARSRGRVWCWVQQQQTSVAPPRQ